MKLRFSFLQATPVVPEPMKQSKTVSFSLLLVLIIRSIMSIGFCVGCWVPEFGIFTNPDIIMITIYVVGIP